MPAQQASHATVEPRRDELARFIDRLIARIDALLTRQVNAILHHPAFQKLEASWRGLRYLVDQVEGGENIKVRILSVTWRELTRDLERALEFDQSQLFRKVYSEEFGTPGGEPFGALLIDHEVRPRPSTESPTDDIEALGRIAGVAAAAFAPAVLGVHPSLLELDEFAELDVPRDLGRVFEQTEYLKWRSFRRTEDARFVGLVLPRVLMRMPYGDDRFRRDGFHFREEAGAPDGRNHLWGTAVYAFGGILVRAFAESGWLAAIRGVERGAATGGLVTGLPAPSFGTEPPGVAWKCPTDTVVTDARERELGELGFIPLCHCQGTELAAFYANASVQKPETFDEPAATVNARLSSMLQYMLCVSRFAHYVKVLARDKVGRFAGPAEVQEFLKRWLSNYVVSNDDAGLEMKTRYPLREAKVQVRERADKPGTYHCVVHLRPHCQLDQLVSSIRLTTELAPAAGR